MIVGKERERESDEERERERERERAMRKTSGERILCEKVM